MLVFRLVISPAFACIPVLYNAVHAYAEHIHFGKKVVDGLGKELFAAYAVNLRFCIVGQKEPHSSFWVNHSGILQEIEGFYNRMGVDRHLQRHFPDGRDLLARQPLARENAGKAIVDNLSVYGFVGLEVHLLLILVSADSAGCEPAEDNVDNESDD